MESPRHILDRESLENPLTWMLRAISSEEWAAWDWTKLSVFSQIQALVTDIDNRLEANRFNRTEYSRLRWAYEVARGFENCVKTVFEKLDKDLLVKLMQQSSVEVLQSSHLMQEETWLDVINVLRSRIDRLHTEAVPSGLHVTPLVFEDFAALSAGIPLSEATLKSEKSAPRFGNQSEEALTLLRKELLDNHLSEKKALLAPKQPKQQGAAARWVVNRAQYSRRMPAAIRAINRYLDSQSPGFLPYSSADDAMYEFRMEEYRCRREEMRHAIGYMKQYSTMLLTSLGYGFQDIIKLDEEFESDIENNWYAAVRKLAQHFWTTGRLLSFCLQILSDWELWQWTWFVKGRQLWLEE